MNVLLIKDPKEYRQILHAVLEAELGCEVTECPNPQEALMHLLDDQKQYDLVICEDLAENQKILKYLMTLENPPKAAILKRPGDPSVLAFPDLIVAYLDSTQAADEIKKLFSEKIAQIKEKRGQDQDTEYCRVGCDLVTSTLPLVVDVYLRLSSLKYVRIFKNGDVFKKEEFQTFLTKKGITYLYLKKADSVSFIQKLKGELAKEHANPNLTQVEAAKASINIHEAVANLGLKLGFTPEVQELAKEGIKMTLKSMGTSPKLAKHLKALLAEKDKYIASHSIGISQVACALAFQMNWPSETTFQKLSFAAFFHDITLTNHTLAQIKTLEELKSKQNLFTHEEVLEYKNHPVAAAELVGKMNEVPADVYTLIANHHERPDGTGFPRAVAGSQIAPLSALFIFAHDLVDFLYAQTGQDPKEFLAEYRAKNSVGHFKKMLDIVDIDL